MSLFHEIRGTAKLVGPHIASETARWHSHIATAPVVTHTMGFMGSHKGAIAGGLGGGAAGAGISHHETQKKFNWVQ